MFCPECGTQNPPNPKFCNQCEINLLDAIKDTIPDNSEVSTGDEAGNDSEEETMETESDSSNN